MSEKNGGVVATPGNGAMAPAPITTDVSPVQQPIIPDLITQPAVNIYEGGLIKGLHDLALSTWQQASSIIEVPLDGTSGTVILNVPMINDYVNDSIKLLLLLHDRWYGSIDYRVTLFGASTIIGGIEVGTTIRKFATPTINDLRVIHAETVPANNTQVYTFTLGPTVDRTGVKKYFFTTTEWSVSAASKDFDEYPCFVVMQNVPLQSNMSTNATKIYMRIETKLNPSTIFVVESLSRISDALKKLTASTLNNRWVGASPIAIEGIPLSQLFNWDNVYISTDGRIAVESHSSTGLNYTPNPTLHCDILIPRFGNTSNDPLTHYYDEDPEYYGTHFHDGKWNCKLRFSNYKPPDEAHKLIVGEGEDPYSLIWKYDPNPLNFFTVIVNSNWHYDSDKFPGFKTADFFMTVYGYLVYSSNGKPIDLDFNLKQDDWDLQGTKDGLGRDPNDGGVTAEFFNSFFYSEGSSFIRIKGKRKLGKGDYIRKITGLSTTHKPSYDDCEYSVWQPVKRIEVEDQNEGGIAYGIPRSRTMYNDKLELSLANCVGSEGLQIYVDGETYILLPFKHVHYSPHHEDATSPFYTVVPLSYGAPPNADEKKQEISFMLLSGLNLQFTSYPKISDFTFSYGPFVRAPKDTSYVVVPETSRRLVFTDYIPQSVDQTVASTGVMTVPTAVPKPLLSLQPGEVLRFNLVSASNNQTLFECSYDGGYGSFYFVPKNSSLVPYYATFNTYDAGKMLVKNVYMTTIGNLPGSSLASTFVTRIVDPTDKNAEVIVTDPSRRNGPTLTRMPKSLL